MDDFGVNIARSEYTKAIAERDALRETNEVLAGKLDDMIIVNGQALACSSYVRAEVDELRGKVALLRAACDNVAGNMERAGMWSDWHNQMAVSILRNAYNATA